MTYEESILSPGEKVLGVFREHILPGIGSYWLILGGGGAALTLGILSGHTGFGIGGAGLLFTIWAVKFFDWLNSVLVITNKRAIKGSGILSKTTRDSALEKVTDLVLSQGVIGRILDYGTLKILTANENADDVFPGLGRPKIAKSILLEAKSALESGGGRGQEGDLTAIERLNSRGLLSDSETKILLKKIAES